MSVKWLMSISGLQDHNFRSGRVFGYILLVIKMQIMKKLDDLKVNNKFRGGWLGIKGFYKFLQLVQLSTAKKRLSIAKRRLSTAKLTVFKPSSTSDPPQPLTAAL
ncbi:hypothetical protein Tco_1050810, partial [Tanacetum coccineum]